MEKEYWPLGSENSNAFIFGEKSYCSSGEQNCRFLSFQSYFNMAAYEKKLEKKIETIKNERSGGEQ
jgi:hypothetical protein